MASSKSEADAKVAEEVVATEMVTLRSSDGELFEVPMSAMREAETIKNMIDDNCATGIIPLPNVEGPILAKVTEYCIRHAKDSTSTDDLKRFDDDFINVDLNTLYDLLMAANYMSIQGLLELACKSVADQIRGKTPEEIRNHFHIVNDFTGEEEEEIRRDNSWTFND